MWVKYLPLVSPVHTILFLTFLPGAQPEWMVSLGSLALWLPVGFSQWGKGRVSGIRWERRWELRSLFFQLLPGSSLWASFGLMGPRELFPSRFPWEHTEGRLLQLPDWGTASSLQVPRILLLPSAQQHRPLLLVLLNGQAISHTELDHWEITTWCEVMTLWKQIQH